MQVALQSWILLMDEDTEGSESLSHLPEDSQPGKGGIEGPL